MKPDNLYYNIDDLHFVKGEGVYVTDIAGNKYIDCCAGTFNLSLGYNNNKILNAVHEQLKYAVHFSSSYCNDPLIKFVNRLAMLTPKELKLIHPKVCSGSVANEGAIRMAQKYTQKSDIISWFRSHLGQTIAMTNLSGNSFRRKSFPNSQHFALHVPDPYCHRCFYRQKPETCAFLCVERINDFILYASSGNIACMIVEPITGNGGNVIPPKGYFRQLKKLCDENDIILIFDEIQTGIGRTGYLFASEYFEIVPDIMTLAKGLGGIGFQIAAIVAKDKFQGLETYEHSFTYGANLLGMTAAEKTLEIVSDPNFLDNVKKIGGYIIETLKKIKKTTPIISDIRGLGLMIGVEISDSDGNPDVNITNRIVKLARNKYKLLLRTSMYGRGNVIKIRPSLNISQSDSEEMCNRLIKLFDEFNTY